MRYHGFLLGQLPPALDEAPEVGCGTGAFARALARRCGRVLALDLSPRTIEVVRFRLSGRPNIEYAVADANAWPFPEGRFGCVTSITTLHHRPLAPTLRRGWGPPSGQAGLCWRSTSTGQGAMLTSSWGH